MGVLAVSSVQNVAGGVLLFGVLYFVAHITSKALVTADAESKGWKDIAVRWTLFSPSHYRVTYTDKNGNPRDRHCVVQLFWGIYWRDY